MWCVLVKSIVGVEPMFCLLFIYLFVFCLHIKLYICLLIVGVEPVFCLLFIYLFVFCLYVKF